MTKKQTLMTLSFQFFVGDNNCCYCLKNLIEKMSHLPRSNLNAPLSFSFSKACFQHFFFQLFFRMRYIFGLLPHLRLCIRIRSCTSRIPLPSLCLVSITRRSTFIYSIQIAAGFRRRFAFYKRYIITRILYPDQFT